MLIMNIGEEARIQKNKYDGWDRYSRIVKATIMASFATAALFGLISIDAYEKEANPRTMVNDIAYVSKGHPSQSQRETMSVSQREVDYLQGNTERALEASALAMAIGAVALAYGEAKRFTS